MNKNVCTFAIGLFAGLCAIFVPRMGGLLAAEDMTKVTVFPFSFIALGLVYATVIGVILAIHENGRNSTPRDRFMLALGIPAMLVGSLSTSQQAGEVNRLTTKAGEAAEIARTAEGIRKDDRMFDLQPIRPGASLKPPAPGPTGLPSLLGISTAHAQAAQSNANQETWRGWAPIRVDEPRYAIIVDRAGTPEAASRRADELRGKFPDVQAVKIQNGYGVSTGVKGESAAILDAVKIKRESNLNPELLRVK